MDDNTIAAGSTSTKVWTRIADVQVRHIWINDNGEDAVVSPDWYAENGTPIGEDGEDMTYSHTEIAV